MVYILLFFISTLSRETISNFHDVFGEGGFITHHENIFDFWLQLNKANTSDTEAAFLDLHLSISNDIISTKIDDKRDDFDFEIVISHF